MKLRIALLALSFTLSLPLWAADPGQAGQAWEEIRQGIACHDQAQTAPERNIEQGKALLYPHMNTSPLAKGYYGSLLTLEAGLYARRNNVLRAMTLLDEGTSLIDESVRAAPDLVDLHALRMINSYEVSNQSPMDRYDMMKTDIDWFEERRNQLSGDLKGMLELYKGFYYLKNRRIAAALDAFELCVKVSPGSPEAREAERQLRRYGE
jgi:tetratricopeptide (TPR) repeat protein